MTPNNKVPRGNAAAERERQVINFARDRLSFTVQELIHHIFEGRFKENIPTRIYVVYKTACLDLQRLQILKGFAGESDEYGLNNSVLSSDYLS